MYIFKLGKATHIRKTDLSSKAMMVGNHTTI